MQKKLIKKKLQLCVVNGTKVNMEIGICLIKWYWFYSYLFFLWRIYDVSWFLLNIAIVRWPQLTTPPPSFHGISCFLLEIAIVKGPQLVTPSQPFYGLSCFLLKIASVRGSQLTHPPFHYCIVVNVIVNIILDSQYGSQHI